MSTYEHVLFGLGNPLLDISAVVPYDFAVKKYKAEFGNAVLANEEQKKVYKDITDNYDVKYSAGGATLNVFRVFQWMINQDYQCGTFVGCVGKDKYSEEMIKQVKSDKVNAPFQRTEEVATGTCAVLICKDERTLIANVSAAEKFQLDYLKQKDIFKFVEKAKFYYISGFFITVSVDAMIEVAKHALANNKPFMMNLSAIFLCQFFIKDIQKLLPYVDILFSNEDEAKAYAKTVGWETQDVLEIAKKIAQFQKLGKRKRIVVFTQGKDPICTAIQDGDSFKTEIKEIPKSEIVDVNGAGDAFCGGFISRLVQGKSIKQCIQAGIYSSGVILRNSGCSYHSKPTFKDAEE